MKNTGGSMGRKKNAWDVLLTPIENELDPFEVRVETYWDPEKVESHEVAQAAAIEHNYFQPKGGDGLPLNPRGPISATPV